MRDFLHRAIQCLTPGPLRRKRSRASVKTRTPHDAVYDADFFRNVIENHSGFAAHPMAESIMRDLAPRSVLDVGCGGGHLLEALRGRGCEVFGLEYAALGVAACQRRRIPVRRFNIEQDSLDATRRYDVVCSIEVAEHLPKHISDRYVSLLAAAGDCLVFSAATPGQGGTGHLNEQPRAYWIGKFGGHGFALDAELSARWSREWERAGVQPWFWRNIMVFRRPRARHGGEIPDSAA